MVAFLVKVTKSERHQMLREQKILRIRAHLYIEPAAMTGRDLTTTAAGVVGIIKQIWYLVLTVVAVHT